METREIDQRLQQYTAAEHRIGANLQELEQHAVYQLLTTDVLTGATAKALQSVKTADPSLWDMYALLSTTLDGARRVRGTGRINQAERRDLTERLFSDSVILDTDVIPLGQRGLTGSPSQDERVSISELIDRMANLYEPMRDVVTHAETVLRGVLPRLNSAEATLASLRADATALGINAVELDRIEQTVQRIRDLSITDPISIPSDARKTLDGAIHDASVAIAAARVSHNELAADMAAATDLLDSCRDLILQAIRSRADAVAKVSHPIGLRRPPSMQAIDGPKGLSARLKPVLSASGPWQNVRAQLDAWSVGAKRFHTQLEGVVAANQQPLDKRDELRGRFAAFRAKMAATGYSEDPVLRDMSAEAHNELFTAPTDLARAEKLVAQFGARMATT